MAIESGLGDALFIGGYDLSGDSSVVKVNSPLKTLGVTPINKSAECRIGGHHDAAIDWTSFFNDAAGRAHPVLSALPGANTLVTYCRGTTIGNAAACHVAKQVGYDGKRDNDGKLILDVKTQLSDGACLMWGQQLTAGLRTDTAATDGAGVSVRGWDHLLLPGAAGAYASTPDAAAISVVGDIDIRVLAAADDWTPAGVQTLLGKFTTAGNQRSYALVLNAAGTLSLVWSSDGAVGTVLTKTSTAAPVIANGTALWVRATLDINNGAAGNDVRFYTAPAEDDPIDGLVWTQLGATVTTAGATSIYDGTAVLELGSQDAGTSAQLAGKIYKAEVYAGIGGTLVAAPIPALAAIADATGLAWTVNGTATLSTHSVYGLDAYLQVTAFTGTDVTVKLQESTDNGVADAWADVAGGAFTAVTAAPAKQRITTALTLPVDRYLRAVTTTAGGFTLATFSVVVARNMRGLG